MSEITGRIKITFDNVIKVYSECSSLLQDADTLMADAGFTCTHANTVGTEHSKGIDNPEWWLAPYAARYFKKDEDPFDLRGLAVVFLDLDSEPVEPVVVLGGFRLKPGAAGMPRGFGYWYLRSAWFSLAPSRKLGMPMPIPGKWEFEKGFVQGVSLEAIHDLASLKTEAIDPLVDLEY